MILAMGMSACLKYSQRRWNRRTGCSRLGNRHGHPVWCIGNGNGWARIHAELVRLIERLRRGVEISDRTLATDSIIQVGPGGHFLEEPLTLENLRSGEFISETCFDRLGERSPNRFEDSLLARAHRRVEELIAAHVPAVSGKTRKAVDRWTDRQCRGI